jgi:hypothetical protein
MGPTERASLCLRFTMDKVKNCDIHIGKVFEESSKARGAFYIESIQWEL